MPRRSRADLELIPLHRVDDRPNRLPPPPDLGENERVLWLALVGGCAPEHFKETDTPLLRQYVEMVALAERAAQEMQTAGGPVTPDGRMSPWFNVHQRAVRSMAVLSMRLRLAPSARSGAREAGRAADRHVVSYYDRMDAERAR